MWRFLRYTSFFISIFQNGFSHSIRRFPFYLPARPMGSYLSTIRRSLGFTRDVRVLLVGLDNAGKTTILYRLQLGEVLSTVPTVGFNIETVQHDGMQLQAWDIGGQTTIRDFWKCYYRDTDVVLFVVDGTDAERMSLCKTELMGLVLNTQLRRALIAVVVNKSDAKTFQPIEETKRQLRVDMIRPQQWKVFATSAVTGEGLDVLLEWIGECMRERGVV